MVTRLSAFSSRARFGALGALAAVAGAVLAATACAKPADTGPIKVGHYASMTGKEATFG